MTVVEAITELTTDGDVRFRRALHIATLFFGEPRIKGAPHLQNAVARRPTAESPKSWQQRQALPSRTTHRRVVAAEGFPPFEESMNNADFYDYRVTWSEEDECFIGRVTEWPSLAAHGATPKDALREIRRVVEYALEDIAEANETPPAPLSKRQYSGKLVLRMPPEMHASFAAEAERSSTSLNQLLVAKLQARALQSMTVTRPLGRSRRASKATKKPKPVVSSTH